MTVTKGKNGFEREVLTHLSYIKDTQKIMSHQLECLNDKFEKRRTFVDEKINCINKDINTAKGMAKGAFTMGSLGLGSGLLGWLSRLLK